MVVIVAKGSWESYTTMDLDTAAMQGRYLYGGLLGLILVGLAGLSRLPARLRRYTPVAVFGFAVLIQAAYVWYTIVLIWAPANTTGHTALTRGVAGILQWYPFPPATIVLIAAATTILAGTVLMRLVRAARRVEVTGQQVPASA